MKEYTTYKDMACAIANKQFIYGNSVTAFTAVDSYIVKSYNTPMLVIDKNNIVCINVKKIQQNNNKNTKYYLQLLWHRLKRTT